jgi:predicted nucleic acid-binding protein
MELYRGMENKKDLLAMQSKIRHYNVLHFNDTVSALSLQLIEQFKLSHNLQIPDAIIGAVAIEYELPLFTYNTKDFSFMPNIQLYKL